MKSEKPNITYSGSGTPIVLLHSSMSSKAQWYRLMQKLGDRYLTIAVDLYGYGETPFPTSDTPFTLMDEIRLIDSLLADLIPPDEPFHLVGHSYGAAIGLRYCYQHIQTNRIRSLSIYEPVAFHLLPEEEEAKQRALQMDRLLNEKIQQGKLAEATEYFVDFWSGAGTYGAFPESIQELLLQGIKKLPLDFQALVGEPLTLDDYRQIEVPVCLMAGSKSAINATRISQLLPRYLPNCQTHWLDAGHMAPVYQTEKVNLLIENFICNQ